MCAELIPKKACAFLRRICLWWRARMDDEIKHTNAALRLVRDPGNTL